MRTGIGGIALAGSSTHFAVPRTEAESSRELAICNGQKLYLSHHRRSLPTDRRLSQAKEAGYLAKRRSSVSPEGGRTRATTNYARSARVSFGCRACRRSSASSWRSTRISSSFEPRGRPSSHRSASTFRTARYANDQSKQPSLDHDSKSPNLAKWPCSGRQDEVCEPYGFTC